MPIEDHDWSIATGQYEGRPILIRFRQLPAEFPKHAFPSRFTVFWTMDDTSSMGLPSPDETRRMQAFENRLVYALEDRDEALLAVVLTTNGKREFVLHARLDCDFRARLESMPQETAPYPITIVRADDVEWDYVDQVLPTA